MITLANGNSIDMDMLGAAMEDSDLSNRYFLNLVTGEVVFLRQRGVISFTGASELEILYQFR